MSILSAAQLVQLSADIKRIGLDLGFAKLGIATTDLTADERRLDRWLALGRHGTMSYMERHGRKRSRPAELVPGTVRVISARMSYWPDRARDARAALADSTVGYVARYALGRDYHKVLRRQLKKLAAAIAEQAGEFGYRVFVDSAPVLEKALARKAGLGWVGKHTNLLDRDGSWFLLGELYTDLPLEPDTPVTEHCGSCRACIDVCPTQAIVAPYELDARRCISYLTIELKGSIPEELRPAIGNRIFGCDDCQIFCPWNKFAQATSVGDFAVRHGLDSGGLVELFAWSETDWQARTEGSALRRAGYPGWLRNIAVALGNAPADPRVIAALEARVGHASEIVREHVHWALARQRARRLPAPRTANSVTRLVERAPYDRAIDTRGLHMGTVNLEALAYGIDTDFRRSLLQGIALFRGIDAESLSDLLPQCGRIDVTAGQVLLSPERENHCVYVVLSGRLSVHLGSLEAPKIADLGPGSCAGEMSLIEDKDPSAFVVATENCHLMVISHTLLWRLVDRSHTFCKNLLVVLSERVRSDNEYIASSLGVLRQAERNAHTDALTGLGNRHWMRTMFEREVTRTLHSKKALCLMMIDVDNFKVFNDQYGHIAGDRVLVAVADALREYLRPTDLVARFGGDEFAVLLPDLHIKQARQTAERIRQQIAGLSPPSLSTAITVSIGVADRADHDDVATLVQRADAAMYDAKVSGRNRVSAASASNE